MTGSNRQEIQFAGESKGRRSQYITLGRERSRAVILERMGGAHADAPPRGCESSGFFPSGGSAKKRTWRVQSLFSSGPRPPQCPRRPSVSYSPPFVPVVGFASASNRLALMATYRGCCSDVGSLFQARRLRRTSTRRPSPLRALPLRRLLLPPRSPRSPRSRRPPPLPRL